MSYNFGQFRKSQQANYMINLEDNLSVAKLKTMSGVSDNIYFIDKQLSLKKSTLQATNANGTAVKSYYLRFTVDRKMPETLGGGTIPGTQSITVKLHNSTAQTNNTQFIDTVIVSEGAGKETFEMIIQPNANYDAIDFTLSRSAIEYNTINDDGSYGREATVVVEKLTEVLNIIESISGAIDNKTSLKQIGVQARPGMLMTINGEGIKVGRSGIYEINNGVVVNSIGFVIESGDNNQSNYFILDYQY